MGLTSASPKWLLGRGFCWYEFKSQAPRCPPYHVYSLLSLQESLALCLWTPREKGVWITPSMLYRSPETGHSFFLSFAMIAIRK